jgi:hypothetical protein
MFEKIKKITASYVIFTMIANPLITSVSLIRSISPFVIQGGMFSWAVDALADDMQDAGRAGQALGKSVIKGFSVPNVNSNTGEMNLNLNGQSVTLQREDVFQGASEETESPSSLYGNDIETIQKAGQVSNTYLAPESNSATSNAYKLLRSRDLASRPRLTQGDPIAVKANDIYSDKNGDISAILQSCTSTSTTSGETFINYGSPMIETCDRLTIADERCEVKHELVVDSRLIGVSVRYGDTNDSGEIPGPIGTCTLDFKNGTSRCELTPRVVCTTTYNGGGCNFFGCDGGGGGSTTTCTNYTPYGRYFSMTIANAEPFDAQCGTDESYFMVRQSEGENVNDFGDHQLRTCFTTGGRRNCVYFNTIQRPSCTNEMVGKYQVESNCAEDPCYGFNQGFSYNTTLAKVEKDEWYVSPSCAPVFNAIDDGTICQGSVSCENDDANGCVMLAGILSCPNGPISNHLQSTPAELTKYSIPNVCTDIKVETTCNTCLSPDLCNQNDSPTQNCTQYSSESSCTLIRQDCLDGFANADGTGCYAYQETYDCDPDKNRNPVYKNCTKTTGAGTGSKVICDKDANGVEHCQTYDLSVATDSCTAYAADDRCRLVYEDTPDSLKDAAGEAIGSQLTYDCGFPLAAPPSSTTTATCNGATIRCMGTDCIDVPTESNKDFGQVLTNAQIINFSQQDSNCATTGDCMFFKGEFFTCKSGFFGIVDCCSSPKGVGPFEYLQLITDTWALAQRTDLGSELAAQGKDVAGSLYEMTAGAAGLDDILSPMTSAFDQISSTLGNVILQPGTQWLNIAPELSTSMYQFVAGSFGDDVALQLFDPIYSGTELTGQFGLNVTNLMSSMQPLLTAYQIYQLTVLIIQIIWSCEDEEFELGAKKAMRLCHYNGKFCDQKVLGVCILKKKSYCCFNSPFARIMQEQVRPQLGKPWGSAKHPDCTGITIAQLGQVDFSKVDLGEWISLLKVGNIQDTSIANAESKLSLENMTKYTDKSAVNKDSVYERVDKGVGQVDLIEIKESVTP